MSRIDELKPCPFCGHTPTRYGYGDMVKCDNSECLNTINGWPDDFWNIRPTEDALNARITEIEAAAEDIWVNSLGHSGDTGDCAEYYLANIKLDLAEMFGRPSPPKAAKEKDK